MTKEIDVSRHCGRDSIPAEDYPNSLDKIRALVEMAETIGLTVNSTQLVDRHAPVGNGGKRTYIFQFEDTIMWRMPKEIGI